MLYELQLMTCTVIICCSLICALTVLYRYTRRDKRSAENEVIRVMVVNPSNPSEHSAQAGEASRHAERSVRPRGLSILQDCSRSPDREAARPRGLSILQECARSPARESVRPLPDVLTTAECSPHETPLESPFQAYELVIPNAYEDTEEGTSPYAGGPSSGVENVLSGRLTTQRTARMPCFSNDAASPPIDPAFNMDICLMDVEMGELGKGASGRVKEAIYVSPAGEVMHVAVKYARIAARTPPSFFRSELEIISKLPPNKNVVRYLGGNVPPQGCQDIQANTYQGHSCFIVMELMFTNLQDVIHGEVFTGRLNLSLMLSISLDISIEEASVFARHGIIHYDLKPSNVLLDEDFVAKLADFGSSKSTPQSCTTGSFHGTLGYVAPEVYLCQFFTSMKVTTQLDIYSMGVVMWEMVSAEHPPTLSRSSSLCGSLTLSRDFLPRMPLGKAFDDASPERCPPSLRSLIQDCIDPEPSMRPTTQAVKQRLLDIQSSQ